MFQGVLPSERDTWFLRACLQDTGPAGRAWECWVRDATAGGTAPRRALAAVNSLLPLLAWNLGRTQLEVERALQTHFRSALLTEELRWQRYRSVCASAFEVLASNDVPFILLKGAAVGERFYPLPMLRHADDIDVLVEASRLVRVNDAFLRAGWRRDARPVFRQPLHAPPLIHDTDVSIEPHHRLVIPHFTIPYDRLWARAERAEISGATVHVLAPPDALLHTIAHAMQSAGNVRWVADAWFILRRPFDWRTFTDTAIGARLALPVRAALGYLAGEMDVAVPDAVRGAIDAAARQATHADRQASTPWAVGRAFPPPMQFALHYDVPLWTVPYYYVSRLAQYISARRPRLRGLRVAADVVS
jgi:hypothetical protein